MTVSTHSSWGHTQARPGRLASRAEDRSDDKWQRVPESSGLTHNYVQITSLLVHTRIKLCNRKQRAVGGRTHSTSITSRSPGARALALPLYHSLYQQSHFPFLLPPAVSPPLSRPLDPVHSSSHVLQGLPHCHSIAPSTSESVFTFICSFDPHNIPVRQAG